MANLMDASPMSANQDVLVNFQLNNSAGFTSTTPSPNVNNTLSTKPSGWLGLDSTQVLIVFLIVIFLVLIVFLLIYYYVIRGMRQKGNQQKHGPKSVSASTEKDRSIFAEKQLAVDSSVKAKPKVSEPEQYGQVSTSMATATTSPSLAVMEQPVRLANLETPNTAKKTMTIQADSLQNQPPPTPQSTSNHQTSNSQNNTQDKSKSGGAIKVKKSSSDRKNKKEVESDSVIGALAGLRDTLRETVGNK